MSLPTSIQTASIAQHTKALRLATVGAQFASHIPVLTLTEYLTNAESKSRIPILTITLNEAFITNYQITNADTLHSSEVVAFSYVGVCISSTAVTPQGAAGAKTTVCYNKSTNSVS